MNEDRVVNVSIISLTLKNFHTWIKKIKIIAKNAEIWKFVDSDDTAKISEKESSFNVSDYQISTQADDDTRSITALRKLSDKQRKKHKLNLLNHQYQKKYIDRINSDIMRMQNVIKLFARMYLLSNELFAESRRMLQTLSARYQLSDARIKEQLHETWHALKASSVKAKIKQWITNWENLKQEMIDLKLIETFDNDVIFVNEFLTAKRKWASNFCDNWKNQHKTADKNIEFFKTTRTYKKAVQKESSMSSFKTTNSVTLQEQIQNEKKKNNKSDADKKNVKRRDRKCLCLEMHLFEECVYICKSTRFNEWKENKKIRNEMRQRLKIIETYKVIKNVSDTNFLDEITEKMIKKRQQEFDDQFNQKRQKSRQNENRQNDEEEFRFDNMTASSEYSSLHKAVMYDSEYSDHLTFDKNRFVNEIRSTCEWIKTSEDFMLIEKYDTMLINAKLNEKNRRLLFDNIAYISFIDVTLMFSTKLIKQKFDRCSRTNILMKMNSKKKICDIQMRYNLLILEDEENSEMIANFVQSRTTAKATSWVWHLRLRHCHSTVIEKLKVLNKDITVKKEEESKTIKCETCSLSKMHRIVQKSFTAKAIKSFQILHFDLTIDNQTFNDTTCIAHFTDEFTSYNWTYSLIDHKKKTLISVFKSLINQCDRIDMTINFMIRMIRSDQKTSIENKLNKWIQKQNIAWKWSSKYTSEQSEKSERFEALLIEKTRYIKAYAKILEDLYSECYLAVIYLLNKTFIVRLKWNSSLITLQKCLNESVKWELFNLKVFDSKTYVLLKDSDVSTRSKKLKARVFVKYLIEYDSINIFRVWNLEKWDVNEYRDVIFDEKSFFDTYQTKNQIKEFVSKDHVEYYEKSVQISQTNDLEELNNEEDEWVKKSIRKKIMKMSKIIRKDSIQNDLIQNVDQSVEDDEQLSTLERSSLHDDIIDQQIDSRTSDILQIDLNEDRHQKMSNFHTNMNRSFDRQKMSNLHTDMNTSQSFDNLHTDMKESQSFERQSSQFRTSKSFQSAISTTKLFSLSREKRSLFESSRSLIESSESFNESIRSLESRRHSTDDVSRMKIHSSSSRNLMNQIDEISTDQISLKIIDIFERLNIANKIENRLAAGLGFGHVGQPDPIQS